MPARRARSHSISFRAASGNSPSRLNAMIKPGLRMSAGLPMRPSSVPAKTYTAVPASIPVWLTQ